MFRLSCIKDKTNSLLSPNFLCNGGTTHSHRMNLSLGAVKTKVIFVENSSIQKKISARY